jgi:hypothetical protein
VARTERSPELSEMYFMSCRARLEEMDCRLQRNLEAVDAAQAAAEQAPRTVERVLRSVAAGGKGRRAAAAPAAAAAAAASSQDE